MLKQKALDSLIFTIEAFNSPHAAGRATRVLLHLQHAFEMLLKAALVQTREKRVFDSETGRSIGFERCLRLSAENPIIKLADADAGTLRAIDAMRDDEQHWFNLVPEQLLYLHARAGVTLFDELLQRVFGESLAEHLLGRVLPLSVDPPHDLAFILDEEYSQIAALLQPGRRAGHEARARLRTLLAMEAHVDPDAIVSDRDVTRVERAVRDNHPRDQVFPRLDEIATAIDGEGVHFTDHLTKTGGAPVRYVADDSIPAAGIREVDLLKKYHRSPADLAEALAISMPRSTALRRHLRIDEDDRCSHLFELGAVQQRRYSDNAYRMMRDAVDNDDLEAVGAAHSPKRSTRSWERCAEPGCRAG
ncbi:DUF3644 domain-containing protein [Pseudonocardia sp. HH130629-09]|uniref:DUF3644 domain-containing protein n=1 Tax=Pseudonocardia sp. HH130629-09 TaxID=1641402 RepID=UPI0007DC418D|nr:DUF3644 domain-containing protein [Pseudonocardia sp. HH130629-09]